MLPNMMFTKLIASETPIDRLPPNYVNLPPKRQAQIKKDVKSAFAYERLVGEPKRKMVVIGVTRPFKFMDVSLEGEFEVGKAYNVTWDEYEKLVLDSVRSSYVCRLDQKRPSLVEEAVRKCIWQTRAQKAPAQ